MKRKLLALVLMNVLILLFSAPILCAKTEIEPLFVIERSLYTETKKTSYGGGLHFLLSKKSYYVDICGTLTKRKDSSGVEDFRKNYLRVEIENSLWWKWLIINVTYDVREERARLFLFDQPKEIIMLEKWNEEEITGGLGLKVGNYEKSFIRIAGIAGRSYYQNKADLKFLDMILERNNSRDTVIGGKIRGRLRLEVSPESKQKRPSIAPIWIDFQAGYNHYLESRECKVESTLGLGIKIVKWLGIKGSITGTKKTEDKKFRLINCYLSLVFML